MSAHSIACRGSQDLCEELYAAVKALAPQLRSGTSERWCFYYAPGRKRFAYVAHYKTTDRVQVWCRGDLNKLQKAGPPLVKPRGRTESGGWEREFPGRFELTSATQIPAAARLLHAVSYARS